MSFVGARPEVKKYVKNYTNEMKATLLLPAGITSEASIKYKDESQMLTSTDNAEKKYIEFILPQKMRYNLDCIREFSCINELRTMAKTIKAVFSKEKKNEG